MRVSSLITFWSTTKKALLKLCDLGSASDTPDTSPTPYLVGRFYRAPETEIILGVPHYPSLDVRSVGCTLFELYTGKILFPVKSNAQMLMLMMEAKGRFSARVLRRARFAERYFDERGRFVESVERDQSPKSWLTSLRSRKSRCLSIADGRFTLHRGHWVPYITTATTTVVVVLTHKGENDNENTSLFLNATKRHTTRHLRPRCLDHLLIQTLLPDAVSAAPPPPPSPPHREKSLNV